VAAKELASDAVRLEVRRAYYDVDEARQQIEVGSCNDRRVSGKSCASIRTAYDSGLSTITDLLASRRGLTTQPDGLLGSRLSLPYRTREPRAGQRNLESSVFPW